MKKLTITLSAMLLSLTAHSQQFQQEYGNARKAYVETIALPNHADSYYLPGENATLEIIVKEGGNPINGTKVYYKTGKEMLLPAAMDSTVFTNGKAIISMGTMQEPGFLACQYEFSVAGKKYGDLVKLAFTPEKIKAYTEMPKDFEKFWQKVLK